EANLSRSAALDWRDDARADDPVEQRKLAVEVGVATLLDRPLPTLAHAAARVLAVARVQAVHCLHPLHHLAQHRERLDVVAAVVPEVDVDLCEASVRAHLRERERAA